MTIIIILTPSSSSTAPSTLNRRTHTTRSKRCIWPDQEKIWLGISSLRIPTIRFYFRSSVRMRMVVILPCACTHSAALMPGLRGDWVLLHRRSSGDENQRLFIHLTISKTEPSARPKRRELLCYFNSGSILCGPLRPFWMWCVFSSNRRHVKAYNVVQSSCHLH